MQTMLKEGVLGATQGEQKGIHIGSGTGWQWPVLSQLYWTGNGQGAFGGRPVWGGDEATYKANWTAALAGTPYAGMTEEIASWFPPLDQREYITYDTNSAGNPIPPGNGHMYVRVNELSLQNIAKYENFAELANTPARMEEMAIIYESIPQLPSGKNNYHSPAAAGDGLICRSDRGLGIIQFYEHSSMTT